MNKTAIKNFAIWARRKLISEITYKAGLIGISEKGIAEPLPTSTDNIEFYDIGTGKPTEIMNEEVKQRKALVERIKEKEKTSDYKTAFQFVMEEVAYTWFNRLVAIRFMEVNDYLPSRLRVLSSEMKGKAEPDMVTTPFDTDMEFSPYEKDRIMQLKDENKLDELFRMLFIKQCNKLNEVLPELFEKTNDYTEYLLNISFTDSDGIVAHLVNDIVEEDFTEAVEIIGWLYQYYNTEPKEQVFANLKKNIKITKDNIPAATQLFTPDWIVRYMVENSLGRLWVEGHPNDSLKSEWEYYLDEAEQEESVKAELAKIRADYKNIKLEEIKLIDPCMGSGHILVYAFDVLMQIYESQGYTERDAAQSIVENNLYGLDIDERAYQLAYFAIMMKARKYDRRFLTRGIAPQVYCPKGYAEGEEFGSLLNVDELEEKPTGLQVNEQVSFDSINYKIKLNTWDFRRLLNQKYDVVVTNPPYMGGSGMSAKLSDFVKKNYPDSKSDMSTCFMEKCLQLNKQLGYMAMINIPVWMFLSSYEKLREKLLRQNSISTMLHFGRGIFGSDFGSVGFVIGKRHISNYLASYLRLFEKQGAVDSVEQKEKWFFDGMGTHIAQQENFSKIPSSPIAYWVSDNFIKAFENGTILGSIADSKQGIATADNNKYLRLWFECNKSNINFKCENHSSAELSNCKWYPYNKGGEFRKWYGNNDYVVNWKNDGLELRNDKKAVLRNKDFYFKPCFSWSLISSSVAAFRYKPIGHLFDVAGMSCFSNKDLKYLLALCNTNIVMRILQVIAPTINYQCGDIANIPVIISDQHKPHIDELAEQNIFLSKTDWDSFETSWDFEKHPYIKAYEDNQPFVNDGVLTSRNFHYIKECALQWATDCNLRFEKLKANEEELNRIFIDIYGLQDELTPEVEDKDVTVRKAHLTMDIKSFISYTVGCMFGRYSPLKVGLVFAGGEWNYEKIHHELFEAIGKNEFSSRDFVWSGNFIDADNVIPITDEEYFEDDIVGLFVAFVKEVYGSEMLEENLDFIAKALGNRGDTSREVIRNYFVKDFYKDHVKTYQKRPIYWLYDSGKQDGFKALIYMHRYNADTTGKVRVDYLHKMQRTYMSEIDRMQDMIDNSTNPREVAQSEKRKEKLVKQLKETKDYDEKIAHLALSRIAIDLDDGVKVNYDKVQTAQDGKMLDILGKI